MLMVSPALHSPTGIPQQISDRLWELGSANHKVFKAYKVVKLDTSISIGLWKNWCFPFIRIGLVLGLSFTFEF